MINFFFLAMHSTSLLTLVLLLLKGVNYRDMY